MRQCTYAQFAIHAPNYQEMLTKSSNKWQKRGNRAAILGNCPIDGQMGNLRLRPEKQQLGRAQYDEMGSSLRLKTPTGGGDPVGVVEYD
jgi:hypothetical protein